MKKNLILLAFGLMLVQEAGATCGPGENTVQSECVSHYESAIESCVERYRDILYDPEPQTLTQTGLNASYMMRLGYTDSYCGGCNKLVE